MDDNSIKCVYDPFLSKSKSQGSKPIYVKCPPHQKSSDPRLDKTRNYGKRAIPVGRLPLPLFASKIKLPEIEDFVAKYTLRGLNPLISKQQVITACEFYGPVEECNLINSSQTGASLGLATILFASNNKLAGDKLVAACSNHEFFNSHHALAYHDPRGSKLAEVKQLKEEQIRSLVAGTAKPVKYEPQPTPQAPIELLPVEHRKLNNIDLQRWYSEFLPPNSSFLMIPKRQTRPERYNVEYIGSRFSEWKVKNIYQNANVGIYITFDSLQEMCDCYLEQKHRNMYRSTDFPLNATIRGRKSTHADVKEFSRRMSYESPAKNSLEPSALTQRPATTQAEHEPKRSSQAKLTPQDGVKKLARMFKGKFAEQLINDSFMKLVGEVATEIKANGTIDEVKTEKPHKLNLSEMFGGTNIHKDRLSHVGSASHNEQPHSTESEDVLEPVKPDSELIEHDSVDLSDIEHTSAEPEPQPQPDVKPEGNLSAEHLTEPDAAPSAEASSVSDLDSSLYAKIRKTEHSEGTTSGNAESFMEIDEPEPKQEPQLDVKPKQESPNDADIKPKPASKAISRRSSKSPTPLLPRSKAYLPHVELNERRIPILNLDENADSFIGFHIPKLTPLPPQMGWEEIKNLIHSQEDLECLLKELNKVDTSNVSPPDTHLTFLGLHPQDDPPPLPETANANEDESQFRCSKFRVRSRAERQKYAAPSDSGRPIEVIQENLAYPVVQDIDERIIYEEEKYIDQLMRPRSRGRKAESLESKSEVFMTEHLAKSTKKTRLARSSIHDWGLYAEEFIPKDEFVIEYIGEVLRDEYAEVRERRYQNEGIDSTYLFKIGNNTVVDATKRGNGARFINHSCDPNCAPRLLPHPKLPRIALFSIKDIGEREELTFDYNFVRSQEEEERVQCACGAANCRGWLM